MRIASTAPDVDGIEIEIAGRFVSLWKATGEAIPSMLCRTASRSSDIAPQAEPFVQNAPETIALVAPAAPSFDQQQLSGGIEILSRMFCSTKSCAIHFCAVASWSTLRFICS